MSNSNISPGSGGIPWEVDDCPHITARSHAGARGHAYCMLRPVARMFGDGAATCEECDCGEWPCFRSKDA